MYAFHPKLFDLQVVMLLSSFGFVLADPTTLNEVHTTDCYRISLGLWKIGRWAGGIELDLLSIDFEEYLDYEFALALYSLGFEVHRSWFASNGVVERLFLAPWD